MGQLVPKQSNVFSSSGDSIACLRSVIENSTDQCLTSVLTVSVHLADATSKFMPLLGNFTSCWPLSVPLCAGFDSSFCRSDATQQTFPVCFLSCFLFITLYKNLPFSLLMVALWAMLLAVVPSAELIIQTLRQLQSEKLIISNLMLNLQSHICGVWGMMPLTYAPQKGDGVSDNSITYAILVVIINRFNVVLMIVALVNSSSKEKQWYKYLI